MMSSAVWGTPGAAPVLLLHGFPSNALLWRRVGPNLSAEGFRAFAPDFLGFGKSGVPASGKYGMAEQARYLHQFVAGVGLRDVLIVGHDIGGGVAQHFASSYPELVLGLVLVNTVTEDNWPPRLVGLARRKSTATLGALLDAIFGFERVLGRLMRSSARHPARLTRQALAAYAAPLAARGGTEWLVELARSLSSNDTDGLTAKVAAVAAPKLIVWGASDPFTRVAAGRQLSEALPGSTFVEIPNCGHYVPEEEPFALTEAALPFLKSRLPERSERITGRLRRTGEFPKIDKATEDTSL